MGLESPLVEFVHTLRKPQIINGVPQTYKAERKNGDTYDAYKMDFISRPICLGDQTALEEKGSDPKNCPMCKLAKDDPDANKEPQRRYAMHVIRYRTKAGTTDPATPFSVDLVVWSFTDKVFNRIADFKGEWGDLRKHDILAGPCTVEDFQQFELAVANKAAWLEDETRKKLVAETFRENQIPDLRIAVGADKQRQWIEQDIETIKEAWAQVRGHEESETTKDESGLDADLNDLLNGTSVTEDIVPDLTEGIDDIDPVTGEVLNEAPELPAETSDDLLAGLDDLNVEAPEPKEEAPAKAPAKTAAKAPAKAPAKAAAAEPSVENFDDLLNGL